MFRVRLTTNTDLAGELKTEQFKGSISSFGELQYYWRELPISIVSIVALSAEGGVSEPEVGRLYNKIAFTTPSLDEAQSVVSCS